MRRDALVLAVFLTQSLSWFTSAIASFAVRVIIFQTTQSITSYSYLTLVSSLPGLLLWPLAGFLADRFDRKVIIIASDVVASITSYFFMLTITDSGEFSLAPFYLSTLVLAVAHEIQAPAFEASISLIVPPEHIDRAFAMIELSNGISKLLSPVASCFLLDRFGLHAIIAMDVLCCAAATASLALTPFLSVKISAEGERSFAGSKFESILFGVRYLLHHRPLLFLCLHAATSCFFTAFIFELLPPLVLSLGTPEILGYISSFAGTGVLLGSIYITTFGCPKHKAAAITRLSIAQGLTMVCAWSRPDFLLIACIGFVYCFCDAILGSCGQVVWTESVPEDIQGRVFAFRDFLAGAAHILSLLCAGPLSDFLEDSLVNSKSEFLFLLAGSLTLPGEAQSLRLIFVVCGILWVALSLLFHFFAQLPQLDIVAKKD